MHQLLLLRHAKASRDDPRLPDRERPLTHRGLRDAATLRDTMRRLGLAPDLVLVSPARRTMQTLDALEPWDDTPLTETVEELYLADETRIIDVLRNVTETVRSALLVGHNPGIRGVVQKLDQGGGGHRSNSFPTCSLAEFMLGAQWSNLPLGARLIRVLQPGADPRA